MVAFKVLALAFISAVTVSAAPTGLLGGLPPVDLPVTDIVQKVSDSLDGTPLEVVGETLNPNVRVGALDPATGAVDVGVDGTGLLEGTTVDVDIQGQKRALEVDL